MSDKIIRALLTLDTTNDEHWTAEGAPRIDALQLEGVKRADITAVAPHFRRDSPSIDTPADIDDKAKEKAAQNEQAKVLEALGTLDEQIEKAKGEVDRTMKIAVAAKKDYDTALKHQDRLIAERDQTGAARKPIHDIMDYIAATNARKFAVASAGKKA